MPPSMTEDRMVEVFRRISAPRVPSLRVGIGDDAAVFRPAGAREDWLITTDLLLEDVDFRRNWSTPAQLGHKALAVNLSDLAAMGARPRLFFVSLALPSECRRGWIRSFYRGMISLGKRWDAGLAGGDLSRSDSGIFISITAVGESASRKVLLRTGARPDFPLPEAPITAKKRCSSASCSSWRVTASRPKKWSASFYSK